MTLTCPLCQKPNPPTARACESCKSDLTLLSALMNDVQAMLNEADKLRQDGQLAPAVQAYLDVLDADPANAEARAALGPILRALRAPRPRASGHLSMLMGAGIGAAAFAAGYWLALAPK